MKCLYRLFRSRSACRLTDVYYETLLCFVAAGKVLWIAASATCKGSQSAFFKLNVGQTGTSVRSRAWEMQIVAAIWIMEDFPGEIERNICEWDIQASSWCVACSIVHATCIDVTQKTKVWLYQIVRYLLATSITPCAICSCWWVPVSFYFQEAEYKVTTFTIIKTNAWQTAEGGNR